MSTAEVSEDVQIQTLSIALEEQRRVYDWISDNYEQVRVKILTILGGGLAALTFLYASGQLFIPPQVYGRIFYFAALAMLLFAISCLVLALKPKPWEFAIEDKDLVKIHKVKSKLEYLQYMKEKHTECYSINISAYNYKQRLFNISLYPLIFGVIILVVMKLFK